MAATGTGARRWDSATQMWLRPGHGHVEECGQSAPVNTCTRTTKGQQRTSQQSAECVVSAVRGATRPTSRSADTPMLHQEWGRMYHFKVATCHFKVTRATRKLNPPGTRVAQGRSRALTRVGARSHERPGSDAAWCLSKAPYAQDWRVCVEVGCSIDDVAPAHMRGAGVGYEALNWSPRAMS